MCLGRVLSGRSLEGEPCDEISVLRRVSWKGNYSLKEELRVVREVDQETLEK